MRLECFFKSLVTREWRLYREAGAVTQGTAPEDSGSAQRVRDILGRRGFDLGPYEENGVMLKC